MSAQRVLNELAAIGFKELDTGGGSLAMHREIDDGCYLLVTATDDARLPDDETPLLIGRYDDGGQIDGCEFRDAISAAKEVVG